MKMRDLVDNKVFLGGTCGNSAWRDELIPMLEDEGISFFNPVVENWDETAQKEEDRQKKECNVHLYGLSKEQSGAYTFFEIPLSILQNKTVIVLKIDILENEQFKTTVTKMEKDLKSMSVIVTDDMHEVVKYLKELGD